MTREEAQGWILKAAEALAAEPDRWVAGQRIDCHGGKARYCVLGAATMLKFNGAPFNRDDLYWDNEICMALSSSVAWEVARASNLKKPDETFVPRIRKALGL